MTERNLVFLRRLCSSAGLWTVALWIIFSGYEPGFLALVGALTLVGLWEYYTMLDHKGLPNFKIIGLLCATLFTAGSFYYLRTVGPDHARDFELGALLLFHFVVFTRQMFQRTRDISPLETMAYTLFGLLYVPWLFSYVTKIIYLLFVSSWLRRSMERVRMTLSAIF